MTNAVIQPSRQLNGHIRLPGDKSISHRAALLAALGRGRTQITNFSPGLDGKSTLECLSAMGVAVEHIEHAHEVHVEGRGPEGLLEPSVPLDAGNSGTTMRLLIGLLSALPFFSILTGDESLRQRPMGRVAIPLRKMQAKIDGRQQGELAPLAIRGGQLVAAHHELAVASAQLKSALILAGLFAEGDTTIVEPASSRDHTERMLKACGAPIHVDGRTCIVTGTRPEHLHLEVRPLRVPADLSAAAFFIVAGLMVPGSELRIDEVGVNPTRTGLLDALEDMGATVEFQERDAADYGGEPVADLLVRGVGTLKATTIQGDLIPRLIDEIPILAVLATQADGWTEIRDAGELRIKETDRISALVTCLRALGAEVEELPDGMRIHGPTQLLGGEVSSYGDHRIAMAMAVAALAATQPTRILGADCANISDPDFFTNLASIGGKVELSS